MSHWTCFGGSGRLHWIWTASCLASKWVVSCINELSNGLECVISCYGTSHVLYRWVTSHVWASWYYPLCTGAKMQTRMRMHRDSDRERERQRESLTHKHTNTLTHERKNTFTHAHTHTHTHTHTRTRTHKITITRSPVCKDSFFFSSLRMIHASLAKTLWL